MAYLTTNPTSPDNLTSPKHEPEDARLRPGGHEITGTPNC